jgi:hypothetical protein
MKNKLILCLALVLSNGCFAGIIYPKAPDGGQRLVYEYTIFFVNKNLPPFKGLSIEDLTIAAPYQMYYVGLTNLAAGQFLSAVKPGSGGGWQYLLIHGTNSVGRAFVRRHQWLFCQSKDTPPFAIDLSTGNKVQFEISEVRGSAIHAIITTGYKGGTVFEINGDGVAGWPRDGNRSLYFWMSLESCRIAKLPTGWDFSYFSADQKRAVFENVSTNTGQIF